MNLFDSLQVNAQRVVATTMGYAASWTPDGGPTYTATVLFNKPTQKADIADTEYRDIKPRMEYFQGEFPGLIESVRRSNDETVIVDGVSYLTYQGEKSFDGKTIIIYLDLA